jgi:hypothetical protein
MHRLYLMAAAALLISVNARADETGTGIGHGTDKGTACAFANEEATNAASSAYMPGVDRTTTTTRLGECQCGADSNGHWTCSVTWTVTTK